MHALVVAGSAVLGLLVGAVCNVLIDRVPDKVRVARATRRRGHGRRSRGSACPRSRGSCAPVARPTAPLPSRWLWVEVVTVAAFAELAVQYGDTWVLAPLLLLAASPHHRVGDRPPGAAHPGPDHLPHLRAVGARDRRGVGAAGRHRADPRRLHRRRRLLLLPVRHPHDVPGWHGLRGREAGGGHGPLPRVARLDRPAPRGGTAAARLLRADARLRARRGLRPRRAGRHQEARRVPVRPRAGARLLRGRALRHQDSST